MCEMGEDVEKESLSCMQNNAGIKIVQIESGNVKQSNASESLVPKGKQQQICSSSEKLDKIRRFETVRQEDN